MKVTRVFLLLFVLPVNIMFWGCKEESNPITDQQPHFEPEGWLIRDATLKPILVVFQGVIQKTWNGESVDTVFKAPLNALSPHYSVRFLSASKEILNPPSGSEYSLGFLITDTSKLAAVKDSPTDWAFHLKGKQIGQTTIELRLLHGNHADVITPKIPVKIEEDSTAHGEIEGVRLRYEENDSLLVTAADSIVTGSITIQNGVTGDHILVDFSDHSGDFFHPEYPLHTMTTSVSNSAVFETIRTPDEPWVIQIKGKAAGSAVFYINVVVNGETEFTSLAIPVTITE